MKLPRLVSFKSPAVPPGIGYSVLSLESERMSATCVQSKFESDKFLVHVVPLFLGQLISLANNYIKRRQQRLCQFCERCPQSDRIDFRNDVCELSELIRTWEIWINTWGLLLDQR